MIAVVLAIEMKSLLIGESVAPARRRHVRAAILGGPEVIRIIHLRTQHLGPDDVLLAAKLEFSSRSIADLAEAIDTVEARVRTSTPIARLIFFEPDLYDATRTNSEEAPMHRGGIHDRTPPPRSNGSTTRSTATTSTR